MNTVLKTIIAIAVLTITMTSTAQAEEANETKAEKKTVESIELVNGSITAHVIMGEGMKLDRRITADSRVVFNPMLGVGYRTMNKESKMYYSVKGFVGENCISKPIVGGYFAHGFEAGNFDIGFLAGGYLQDSREWDKRGYTTPGVGKGQNSWVPMAGIEVNYKIALGEKYFLKINNVLSPIITNHQLSFGAYF